MPTCPACPTGWRSKGVLGARTEARSWELGFLGDRILAVYLHIRVLLKRWKKAIFITSPLVDSLNQQRPSTQVVSVGFRSKPTHTHKMLCYHRRDKIQRGKGSLLVSPSGKPSCKLEKKKPKPGEKQWHQSIFCIVEP